MDKRKQPPKLPAMTGGWVVAIWEDQVTEPVRVLDILIPYLVLEDMFGNLSVVPWYRAPVLFYPGGTTLTEEEVDRIRAEVQLDEETEEEVESKQGDESAS